MNDELDIDLDNLPEDVDELKQLIVDLAAETRFLREQFNLHIHRRFAASSEKQKYPGQHELFDEAEAEATADEDDGDAETEQAETVPVDGHARKKPGRKPLPEDLPRVEVIHDLAEDEKVCSADGHPLHCIGQETTEQLDIVPARVQVIQHVRYKYGCRHCETGVTTASMPPQVIPKSIATAGLLAWVAVSKYADALPLYRQATIFDRLRAGISRATLANWMVRVGEAVQPLIALMRADLATSRVIQMDETPVQVLKEPDSPPTSKSYMWVSMSGAYDPAIILYDYDPSRSQAVPARLLEGYQGGYLVTDAYKGYGPVIDQNDIIGIGCWAHARRKFDEAQKVQGKHKTGKAQFALNEIRKLYAIEKQLEEKPPDEKRKVRQARAGPILKKFRAWLDKSLDQVPPKTVLGKALRYADSEWDRLVRYLDDGELPIDNNRCENTIRPFVMGRKNWLFSNSQEGAHASAAIYSLIESAKHNGFEPYQYLRYILEVLPITEEEELGELLPHNLPKDMFED